MWVWADFSLRGEPITLYIPLNRPLGGGFFCFRLLEGNE